MGRYFDLEEDLLHYGVLGMKWGIRRYQPYSYTGGSGKEVGEAAKKGKGRKIKDVIKSYKKKKNLAKARKIRAQKASQAKKEEAQKKELIKKITKDATTLSKNNDLARALLSNEEYDKIKNRLTSEQSVYELSKKKQDRGRQTVESVLSWSSTLLNGYAAINSWKKILGGDSSAPKSNNEKTKTDKKNDRKMIKTLETISDALEDLKEIKVITDPDGLLEDKENKQTDVELWDLRRKK